MTTGKGTRRYDRTTWLNDAFDPLGTPDSGRAPRHDRLTVGLALGPG
jgi:hypothetical protein